MDLYLKGKTAIVTGASQGFGRAITKELALEGVQVLAVARNQELLNELVSEISAAGGVAPIPFIQDFTAPDAPQKIVKAAFSSLGHKTEGSTPGLETIITGHKTDDKTDDPTLNDETSTPGHKTTHSTQGHQANHPTKGHETTHSTQDHQASQTSGHIDILVNNAGRSRPLDVIGSEEEWSASLTLDFDRHRQLTQLLLPHFMERRQGAILNIASTYELRSINASAVYKAAIVAWSKQLAGALGQYNIRVNSLQPGLIDTENIRRFFPGEERAKFASREIPLGDFGNPQDIANMATFLVSPRASYITGTVAVVDGGMRHHPF